MKKLLASEEKLEISEFTGFNVIFSGRVDVFMVPVIFSVIFPRNFLRDGPQSLIIVDLP